MLEKTTFFITNEIQVDASGNISELPVAYANENDAYEKYYIILSAAVKSVIPYHAANIIRSDGIMIEGKVYDRRVTPAPEPEPEPESEVEA